MAEKLVYRGETFGLQSSGRYFQSYRKDADERLLHRRIWTDHYGPIPEGMVVHHKDGNWRNNEIANLELLKKGEHSTHHLREQYQRDPNFASKGRKRAQEAAKKWHASPTGLAWHAKHGAETWVGRKRVKSECKECGKKFWTFFRRKNSFCSNSCLQKDAYKRQFAETRECRHCGQKFVANKHRDTAFCSRQCSNRSRIKGS